MFIWPELHYVSTCVNEQSEANHTYHESTLSAHVNVL